MAYTEILLPDGYINANGVDEFDFVVSGFAGPPFADSYPAIAVSAMASNDTPIPPAGDFTWGTDVPWNGKIHGNGHFTLSHPLIINGLIQSVAARELLYRFGGGIVYDVRLWTHGVRYPIPPVYIGQSPYPPGVGWEIWEWLAAVNPFTGLAWTLPELNALEAGFLIQHAPLHFIAIDQLYVLVTYSKVPPTVATNVASNVISASATLNGTLVNDGGEVCTLSFEWGSSMALGSTVAAGTGSTGTSFSANISGLLSGTNYYFRAVATNSRGTSYGAILSLTGTPGPHDIASVDTLPASGVTNDAGLLRGMVTNSLGQYGDVRFEVGGTSSYGNTTAWQSGFFTSNLFQAQLTDLTPGAVYHFRAQFRSSGGIVSGSDQSFVTLSELGPVTFADEETMSLLED